MSKPLLPPLSHLQALVLGTLLAEELPGRELRRQLAEHRVRHTAAAFYQVMARLEREGLVEGRYQQTEAGGQAVTERWYRVTPAGVRAWERTRAFYEAIALAAKHGWSRA
jgi:DNA-binding PadR family transcriptional regulator